MLGMRRGYRMLERVDRTAGAKRRKGSIDFNILGGCIKVVGVWSKE
jgi:hypothetical protein